MMGIKNLHFDEKETLAKLDNMLYNGENSIFDMKDEKIVKEQRKYTLLKELGLEDRIYTSKSEINIQEMLKVNYKESKERLERLRNKSLKYIKESLK